MKKIQILICFVLLFMMVFSVHAAENDTKVLTYKGESEHWTGTFTVKITGQHFDQIGKLKYEGKDIDSLTYVTFEFESIHGTQGGTQKVSANRAGERGTVESRGGGGGPNDLTKVTTILTTVSWNGETERFELHKK